MKTTHSATPSITKYINVDLDVISRRPLDALVDAMGERVLVLYVGAQGRGYGAHVELRGSHFGMGVDKAIRGLVRLLKRLPPAARRLWDQARSREFSIGIEAGLRPHGFDLHLQRETLEAVLSVGATLAVTVYAPDVPPGAPRPRISRNRGSKRLKP